MENELEKSYIFKTDDKYIYNELRKSDDLYQFIKSKIAHEITEPNLRKNGGKLYGYIGLNYPELLVYLKDIKNDEIVGYIGLTMDYGIGLYISQIAVKNEYKHQGIGSIMVKEAIKRAYELCIDRVSADIAPDNKFSLSLFSKHDFIFYRGTYIVDVQKYIEQHREEFNDIKDKTRVF